MPTSENPYSYHVIWLIRRLFRALGQASEDYLRQFGVTAAERAVLEFLDRGGPLNVPAIARRHDVTRQHIQVNVNSLLEKGLVQTAANPGHKRSPLVQLTATGRKAFAAIRREESGRVAELFGPVSDADLQATGRTLELLLDELRNRRTP